MISSVRNLQLCVGQLQLRVPPRPTFLSHDSADALPAHLLFLRHPNTQFDSYFLAVHYAFLLCNNGTLSFIFYFILRRTAA